MPMTARMTQIQITDLTVALLAPFLARMATMPVAPALTAAPASAS